MLFACLIAFALLVLGTWQGYRLGFGDGHERGIAVERAAWHWALKEHAGRVRINLPLCSSCEGLWRKAILDVIESVKEAAKNGAN